MCLFACVMVHASVLVHVCENSDKIQEEYRAFVCECVYVGEGKAKSKYRKRKIYK